MSLSRTTAGLLLVGLLLAGCTSSGPRPQPAGAVAAPRPTGSPASSLPGALPDAQLTARLLQGEDLPGLSLRRSIDPTVELSSSPQLALCRPPGPALPHEVANVLAKGASPGQAQVFEVVAVYAEAAAARQAYDYDVASARACPSYTSGDATFTIAGTTDLPAPAGASAVQYHLVASNVVSGEVRTLAVRGRSTVLISSFGTPPDGSELTVYQAAVAQKALARLPDAP